MHIYKTTITLAQTDAAGIAYFGSVFDLAHQCYESFLDIAEILRQGKYLIPIVHAEADFRGKMELSDKITIEMALSKTGWSSFTLIYQMFNQQGEVVAEAKTIHTLLDRQTGKSIEIPAEIRKRIEQL